MSTSHSSILLVSRIVASTLLVAFGPLARATSIDFERLVEGPNLGNIYADQGVNFSIGTLTGTVAVGNTLSFSPNSNLVWGFGQYGNTWSGVRGAYAPGTDDLMMTFDTAWNQVSVLTDNGAEPGDIVRLIALRDLTGGNFEVLGVAEAMDNGMTYQDCFMSVSSTLGFTHVVFEATTEQEGIDDLQFSSVPEPAS